MFSFESVFSPHVQKNVRILLFDLLPFEKQARHVTFLVPCYSMDSWIILICIVFVSRAWHFEPCPMGRCNLYFSFHRNPCVESYNPNLVVDSTSDLL